MERCPIAIRNADGPQSVISLQDAIAHMIRNPSDCITNQSLLAGNLPQSEGNDDSPRDDPQSRYHNGGQQQQGRNTDEQQPSRRYDTQEQNRSENRDEGHQHSPERHERIRNELAENEVTSATNGDLQTDSTENPSNSDDLAPLPSYNNFMVDSRFCLPAGSRIRSPQYQTFSSRLGTFKNWPSHLTQRPRELAHAGFYSLEKADVVRCFSCDGGLKNWEPEDDPWIEHARWFSNCYYLRHVKGDEFIQLVRLMDEESETEDEQPPVNDEEHTRYMQALSLDDNQEPSVLDADCAQSVIQTGFSDIAVVRAINDLLKEGKEEFGSQDILTVILDKEQEGTIPSQAEQSLFSTSRGTIAHQNEAVSAIPILQENDTLKRKMMCTECGEHERNVLFLPCKHHTVCENCSPHIYVCFTCFRRVRQKVKTYMS